MTVVGYIKLILLTCLVVVVVTVPHCAYGFSANWKTRDRCHGQPDKYAILWHSLQTTRIRLSGTSTTTDTSSAANIINAVGTRPLLQTGLLFSSFNDGLRPNPYARDFLVRSLVRALLLEQRNPLEAAVADSARNSPCCGPTNTQALEQLSQIDDALEQLPDHPAPTLLLLHSSHPPSLRCVYIPTAMYALRAESNNTPGKQRQRARADAKQRRNAIFEWLQQQGIGECGLSIVTLDLYNGSIQHGQGENLPSNGKEALQSWQPHLVYVEGGNTFWLYHCLEQGNWGDDFVRLLCQSNSTTVYCGASAGAILAGSCLETACWKGWDDPTIVTGRTSYEDWTDVAGLGLVGDQSFFPHMSDEWNELVEEKKKHHDGMIVCLREDQVYAVNGMTKEARLLTDNTLPVIEK